MVIFISHDTENEKHLYESVIARNFLEDHFHSTIMSNNLSDAGISFRKDIIRRCDALYVIRCADSKKLDSMVKEDIEFCKHLDIPIYYHDDLENRVPFHGTEGRCPQQSREFINTVMKMYRIHLKKNADYSPANILGTGSVGVIVRMWDKMARIMNLAGFNIKLEKSVEFKPRDSGAVNEPMEDSFWDIAVYAIIKILLDKNVWGK